MLIRVLFCLFFIGHLPIAGKLFGQLPNQSLAFETISDKKGLSHHIINSVFQDSRGFIWIGTDYGLNRYDGVSCTPFFSKPDDPNTLPDNNIKQMAEDRFGNLWIGTAKGIGCLNLYSGKVQRFYADDTRQKTMKDVSFSVFADNNGHIWAGSGYFILRYDAGTKKFEEYPLDGGQSTGNTRNYFTLDLLHDSKGRLWFATSYGVKRFNPATKQFISYHFPEGNSKLNINAIASLAEAPDGQIFAGTWGSGVLVFDETQNLFKPVSFSHYPVAENKGQMVLDITFSDAQMYLATVGGLITAAYPACILQPGFSNWKLYENDPDDLRSIPGQVVNRMMHDRAGNIWLATNNNLARADLRMTQFQHRKLIGSTGEPLIPSCVTEAPSGQGGATCWVGAAGLYRVEVGKSMPHHQGNGLVNLLANDANAGTVWDLHKGRQNLWLATTNGLYGLHPGTHKVVAHYRHIPENPQSIAGNRLWKVHEDKRGRVWVATIRQGISMVDPVSGTIQNYFQSKNVMGSMFNVTPTAFFEDATGDIWIGGVDYLYHYSTRADSFRAIPFSVQSQSGQYLKGVPQPFFEDKNGDIWLAFTGGLVRFNKTTGVCKPLVLHVPFFNPVGEIVVRDTGQIWFGTLSGLFRLDTAGMRLTRFTTRDGLLGNETDGCLTLLKDGSMVTGFRGILTRFFPDGLIASSKPPPLAFSGVLVNGRDTLSSSGRPLKLPYRSTIQFEFSALSFGNAEQNLYTYTLKGADKNWNTPTEKRSVTYANLPYGQYTFLVKGCNSDGVWNETPLEYSFMVSAPFYLQWWFILLVLLLVGSVMYGFYRYRLNQALQVERLRTRLATDLHDDVGATLSAISMYAEALKKQITQPQIAGLLGKIGEDSREMVRTMSDLVWAINPQNDSGQKLVQRMENLATDLCAAAEIKLQFEKDKSAFENTLSIEVRRNMYLIFKEALNNALKYSKCSTITIEIIKSNKELLLSISDDGIGFNAAEIAQGNGLRNMKERALEINGQLTIKTAQGAGCRVALRCPA